MKYILVDKKENITKDTNIVSKEYMEQKFRKNINVCPLCHKGILPNFICDISMDDYEYLVLGCPLCHEIFVVKYTDYSSFSEINSIFPKISFSREFNEEIETISASFVKIYNQALKAETENLDEISGIGYRKALEFLVKDYLVLKYPEEVDTVKKELLGNSIKRIDNTNIKSMAERAVWIGNDETHYVRKWESKDINDLKNLIDLVISWMELELKTEKYMTEMTR